MPPRWLRNATLRFSTVAIQSASASFAASEGWKVKGPTSIQFWLPSVLRPIRSTKPSRRMARKMAGQAKRLSQTTFTRERTNMTKTPIAAKSPCFSAAE